MFCFFINIAGVSFIILDSKLSKELSNIVKASDQIERRQVIKYRNGEDTGSEKASYQRERKRVIK